MTRWRPGPASAKSPPFSSGPKGSRPTGSARPNRCARASNALSETRALWPEAVIDHCCGAGGADASLSFFTQGPERRLLCDGPCDFPYIAALGRTAGGTEGTASLVRASWRDRGCQDVANSVVAAPLQKKK